MKRDPARVAEYNRRYIEKHPERVKQSKREYKQRHADRLKLANKEYRKRARASQRVRMRNSRETIRKQVVLALGGKCACGFEDYRALHIDHVNNDGNLEDKIFRTTLKYLRHVLSVVHSGKYQLLCVNCNIIKYREHLTASRLESIAGVFSERHARYAIVKNRNDPQSRFRMRNRDRLRVENRNKERIRREDTRSKLLDTFGGKCSVCGFNDSRALQIDHVNNDGRLEDRRLRLNSVKYQRHVMSMVDTGKYQLLCGNCNYIKEWNRRRDARIPETSEL